VSSKNYPPVSPAPSSEGCSSQCEPEQVFGSDSVPNSFFLFLSASFVILVLPRKTQEVLLGRAERKKDRPGKETLESFSDKEKPEQLQSADQFEE
jgi:hypothetical protein